jgi:hypothetical protein
MSWKKKYDSSSLFLPAFLKCRETEKRNYTSADSGRMSPRILERDEPER